MFNQAKKTKAKIVWRWCRSTLGHQPANGFFSVRGRCTSANYVPQRGHAPNNSCSCLVVFLAWLKIIDPYWGKCDKESSSHILGYEKAEPRTEWTIEPPDDAMEVEETDPGRKSKMVTKGAMEAEEDDPSSGSKMKTGGGL